MCIYTISLIYNVDVGNVFKKLLTMCQTWYIYTQRKSA